MLAILKYSDKVKEEFYLDNDDITIRRKKDGYYGRFKKDDIVVPYKFTSKRGHEYEGVHIPGTRTTIAIHWILTLLRGIEINDGKVVDHIDGNTKNNKRDNLRIVSQKINCRNRVLRKDNKTGYPGINYRGNLFIVRKQVNGKRLYKSAKTLDEAIRHLHTFESMAQNQGEGYINR